jgi:hypothetical protein
VVEIAGIEFQQICWRHWAYGRHDCGWRKGGLGSRKASRVGRACILDCVVIRLNTPKGTLSFSSCAIGSVNFHLAHGRFFCYLASCVSFVLIVKWYLVV